MNPNVAVVVLSCDAYSDLWAPFFSLFERYWPDCPFTVYLVSNFLAYDHTTAISLRTRQITTWSADLKLVLATIAQPYVICLCDDYLLMRPVKTEIVLALCALVIDLDAVYLRLFPHPGPGPDQPLIGQPEIGLISHESKCLRTSLQCAIWKKSTLISLLEPGETIWEFEIKGSERARRLDRLFLSVCQRRDSHRYSGVYPVTYYCTGIRKGKWQLDAIRLCRQERVDVDLTRRRIETSWDRFKKNAIINRAPQFLRGPLAKWLYGCKYEFS